MTEKSQNQLPIGIKTRFFLSLSCIFVSIFSTTQIIFLSNPVYAEDDLFKSVVHRKLDETERGNISMNCGSIQTSLKNLQKNDSKTRVLLGTSYQTILSNYVSPLNVRLVKNNTPDSNLISIQSEITDSKNIFTSLFITYSQHLETLISIECKTQPDEFYHELENVRFLRSKLEEAVSKVNLAISNHLKITDQLKTKLSDKDAKSSATTPETTPFKDASDPKTNDPTDIVQKESK